MDGRARKAPVHKPQSRPSTAGWFQRNMTDETRPREGGRGSSCGMDPADEIEGRGPQDGPVDGRNPAITRSSASGNYVQLSRGRLRRSDCGGMQGRGLPQVPACARTAAGTLSFLPRSPARPHRRPTPGALALSLLRRPPPVPGRAASSTAMPASRAPLLLGALVLALAVSGVAADVCYCRCSGCSDTGSCWNGFQAGYFDLSQAPCNSTSCVVFFPNYCLPSYTIQATTGPPPGGITPGGIAGLVLLSLAILAVPLLMWYLYERWKKRSEKAQDTVVETYKYEEKYGYNPYTDAEIKGAPTVVAPTAGGYTAPVTDPYASMSASAATPTLPSVQATSPLTTSYGVEGSSASLTSDLGSSSSLAKAADDVNKAAGDASASVQKAADSAVDSVNKAAADASSSAQKAVDSAVDSVNKASAGATSTINQAASDVTSSINQTSANVTSSVNNALK
ncbi:hypothetical protein DFJ74DRAFT_43198 [Hyaloraphidium curvatum]|nr:hypothetical protein DFJ74DRAFT_43198 [Hyaloraphidium curvatum]